MPYKDPRRQAEYNRRWHAQRLELCPLCASLKWPESELCQECRSDWRMRAAELRERDGRGRKGADPGRTVLMPNHDRPSVSRSRSSGRPQPANHPWRKSLTRIAQ